jgi:hypothetical protein
MVWVPLLACPAVFSMLELLDKPAVAPTSKSVTTFENSYIRPDLHRLHAPFALTREETLLLQSLS